MQDDIEGPWFAVAPERANGWWIVSTDAEGSAGCDIDNSGDGGFTEERARLIAAAPDLLTALKATKSWMEESADPSGDLYNTICAAIAKASI